MKAVSDIHCSSVLWDAAVPTTSLWHVYSYLHILALASSAPPHTGNQTAQPDISLSAWHLTMLCFVLQPNNNRFLQS